MKNKADSIRNMLKLDEKSSYQDIITRAIESLVRDGFVEMETEILKSYKVLSSFKYLEELINNINIPEGVQYEIPE